MLDFVRDNAVCFVTGSDSAKSVEQVGEDLFNAVEYSFNCGGNELWKNGILVHRNEWQPSPSVLAYLQETLVKSKFSIRTGTHIEPRSGMMNFSIIGRGANLEQRALYIVWDKSTNERQVIRDDFERIFPDLEIVIAGETGLDIYPRGKDKRQVVDFFAQCDPKTPLVYFGDQIMPGGNDYEIATRCDSFYHVKSWVETYDVLLKMKKPQK